MLPYSRCQQHGCWLKSFAQENSVEPPKFRLFQRVEVIWFDEELQKWRCDRGEIVGLVIDYAEFIQSGWWYFVRLSEIDGCDWLPPGHVDPVHETELRAVA